MRLHRIADTPAAEHLSCPETARPGVAVAEGRGNWLKFITWANGDLLTLAVAQLTGGAG